MHKSSGLTLAIALLCGCAVTTDYHPPAITAPPRWQASPPALSEHTPLVTEDARMLAAWWTWFNDPLLNKLVAAALTQNLDVRAAWSRVREARAERHETQAQAGPAVGIGGGVSRVQNPFPGLVQGIRYNLFEAGFDANWELDLFGRQKRRIEAAEAQVEVAQDEQRWIKTVIVADLVRAYWEMRSASRQIALAEESERLAREATVITRRLVNAGLVARDKVLRANVQAEQFAATLPGLRIMRVTAERQVEVLLGQTPATLEATLAGEGLGIPPASLKMLMSPAAVLRNRPDILQAERQLAAATALKDAAIADLYPRVSLGVFFGVRNTAIGMLLTGISKSWNGGASASLPLLDSGRLRAAIDVRDAQTEAALVNYERVALSALHETELALIRLLEREKEHEAEVHRLTDLRETRALAHHREGQGIAGHLEVIRVEEAVNAARLRLTQTEIVVNIETIAVMKALGAGVPPSVGGEVGASPPGNPLPNNGVMNRR